jgi:lambda family phage tail tape measure protein
MANELKIVLVADASGMVIGFKTATGEVMKFSQISGQVSSSWGTAAATIKQHWLGITAAVYSAYEAMSKLSELAGKAARFNEQMEILNKLTSQYGVTAADMVSDIQEAGRGMIDMATAAEVAGRSIMKGLGPERLKEIASWAPLLSKFRGEGEATAEVFKMIADAISSDKMKSLKDIFGPAVTDLQSVYGKQLDGLSKTEQAELKFVEASKAMAEIMKVVGEQTDSQADKMERFKTQIKDLELSIGQLVLRLAAFAMGIVNLFAAAAAALPAFLNMFQASETVLGGKKSDITSEASTEAMKELLAKSKENFDMAFAQQEMFNKLANVPVKFEGAGGKGNLKWLEDRAEAIREYVAKIQELNPELTAAEKEMMQAFDEYEKLTKKWGASAEAGTAFKMKLDFIDTKDMNEKRRALFDFLNSLEKDLGTEYEKLQRDIDEKFTGAIMPLLGDARWASAVEELIKRWQAALDSLSIDNARKELENWKESMGGVLAEYQQAIDITQRWGETDTEFAARRAGVMESYKGQLQAVIDMLEEFGMTGTDAYRNTKKAMEEMNVAIKKVNATFEEGAQQGIKEYAESLRNTFDKGKSMALDMAKNIEDALVKMFDGPKEAMKGLLDYFLNILKRMVAQALANTVIIPIVATFFGVEAANAAGLNTGGMGSSGGGIFGWLNNLISGGGSAGGAGAWGFGSSASGWGAGIDPFSSGWGMGAGGGAGGGAGLAGYLPLLLPAILAAKGNWGGAIGGAAGFGGSLALGASLGSIIPGIGTVIGAIIGSVVGGLFGGKNRPPAMDLSYMGGQAPYHIGEGWEGGSYQGQAGRVEVVGQHGIDTSGLQTMSKGFSDVADHVKTQMEKMGMDVSGFSKTWHLNLGDLSGKTQEEITKIVTDALNEMIKSLSGIDLWKWEAIDKLNAAAESVKDNIHKSYGGLALIAKNIQLLDPTMFTDFTDEINKWADEALKATPITKLLTDSWTALDTALKANDVEGVTNSINSLMGALQQLAAAAAAMTANALSLIEQMKLGDMSKEQKTDYYVKQADDMWSKYLEAQKLFNEAVNPEEKAKYAEQMTTIGNAFIEYVKSLYGVDPEAAKKYLPNLEQIAKDGITISKGVETAINALTSVIGGTLAGSIASLTAAIGGLSAAIAGISTILSTPPKEEPGTPHASGLDYVPYSGYRAVLHQGEAVLTAQGNSALNLILQKLDQQQPIIVEPHIYIQGDGSGFKWETVKTTIDTIRKYPKVLNG